jgi:hypothetical protein
MNRRGFLVLAGLAIPGVCLARPELTLPRRTLRLLGHRRCSLCDVDPGGGVGFAGAVGRPGRICGDCVDICIDLFVDQVLERYEPIWIEVGYKLVGYEKITCPEEIDRFAEKLLDADRRIQAARKRFGVPSPLKPPESLSERMATRCAFCDAYEDETRRLVATSDLNVCDECTFAAAKLYLKNGRPAFRALPYASQPEACFSDEVPAAVRSAWEDACGRSACVGPFTLKGGI